jgi:hypothetical protein
VTCNPRGENNGDRTPPGPCVPHGGTPAAPVPSPLSGDALFSEQGPGGVVVSCIKGGGRAVFKLARKRGGFVSSLEN